jgi:YspA, cpYpsA-related SLOG family
MRVLICGSRDWEDEELIKDVISSLPPETVVIHGGARGADRIAGLSARKRGLPVKVFFPNWEKYGRAGGLIRNQQMLDDGKPDHVIAFHKANSRGTQDMIDRARKAGLSVEVHTC